MDGLCIIMLLWMAAIFALLVRSITEESKEDEEIKQKRAAHELDVQRKTLDREAWRAWEERRQQVAREQLEKEQEQAQQLQQQALARREQTKLVANNIEEVDGFIKEAQLFRQRLGRVLTVFIYTVPTGRALIRWVVERPQASFYYVIIWQDGETVATENADSGQVEVQLRPGQDYTFQFEAFYGSQSMESPPFIIRVRIPTAAEWNLSVGDVVKVAKPKIKKSRLEIFRQRARRKLQDKKSIESLLGEFRQERIEEEKTRYADPASLEIALAIVDGEVKELKEELEVVLQSLNKKKNR